MNRRRHKALIVVTHFNSIDILSPHSRRSLIDLHLSHHRLGDGLFVKVLSKHEDVCDKPDMHLESQVLER